MPDLVLRGCRAEPLGSYLKALGVFRLLAEQVDGNARGSWRGDRFVLTSLLDDDGLRSFLLDSYVPSPVIAPWNGRSITALNSGNKHLSAIETSVDPRLAPLKETIGTAREILREVHRRGIDPRSNKTDKRTVIRMCRASFPDAALHWLDAVVVLTRSDQAYPLVTGGAGGVLGSGDLSLNFLEHLRELVEPTPGSRRHQANSLGLEAALFGRGNPKVASKMSGQFDPGAAGGANVGRELVNPWDFVLLVEGTLLITAGVARRLGIDAEGQAAVPFTVRAIPVGFGSAAEVENSRGEVWLPIWRRPASLAEIRRLFTEGRATWRGSQARTALDFARSAGALGVDRGIDGFVRYLVSERLGQANLAVPVGRFRVRERRGAPILGQLDPWLTTVRRLDQPSAAVASASRLVDRDLFAASDAPTPANIQTLLAGVAHLEGAVSRSGSARDKVRRPIVGLRAYDWIPLIDDGSPELALVTALASQRDQRYDRAGYLRSYLAPVAAEQGRLSWVDRPPLVPGLDRRPLSQLLTDCLLRRIVEASHRSGQAAEGPGILLHHGAGYRLPLGQAAPFLSGRFDVEQLRRLLSGLLLLDWGGWSVRIGQTVTGPGPGIPPAYALVLPFAHGRPIPRQGGTVELRMPTRWPILLAAGKVADVCAEAVHRLRAARLTPAVRSARVLAEGTDGLHLGAALLIPLTDQAAAALLSRVAANEPAST